MTSRTLVELTGELLGVPSRVEERSKQGLDAGPGGSGLHSWPSASTAMSLGNEMGVMEGGDRGLPVVLAAPESATGLAFKILAADLAARYLAAAPPT